MRYVWGILKGFGLIILGFGLCCAWGVSAYTNVAHAFQLAGTSYQAWAFATTSLAADIFKAASIVGLAAALSARPRYWGRAFMCLAIWVVTMSWSVRSNVGFATTMIFETRDVSQAVKETGAAMKTSIQNELTQLIEQQQWMRKQTTERARGADKHERSDVRELQGAQLGAAEKIDARIDKLRQKLQENASVASAAPPAGDAIGRFFRSYTNLQQGAIDLVTALFFLLVVEIPATFGIFAFGHLFFAPAAAREVFAYAGKNLVPEPEITPLAPIVARAVMQPAQIEAPLARVQAARDRIGASASKRAQAETFLKDIKVVHGAGAVLDGDAVRAMFPEWARREGIEVPLKPHELGQQLMACRVTKEARGAYRLP